MILRERIQQGASEEMQKTIELQKLDAMLGVCETADCRRVMLLQHFGETSAPCGHCDNCLHPPVRFDGTVLVQKLLSCVYRVGQRFAAGYVINVLRGKGDDWIARNGHDKLSTFGIGDALATKNGAALSAECIGLGLLNVNVTLHQSLATHRSGQSRIERQPSRVAAPAQARKSRHPKAERRMAAHRARRAAVAGFAQLAHGKARAEEVPAYVICGDKTLAMSLKKCRKPPPICTTSTAWAKPKSINSAKKYWPSAKGSGHLKPRLPVQNRVTNAHAAYAAALSVWREQQAQSESTTAGKIFSDDSLRDMVENTPATELDLQGIYGLGDVRIQKYGADILAACARFQTASAPPPNSAAKKCAPYCNGAAQTAAAENLEDYQVLSKITLRAIAAKQPQTLAGLRDIHGMDEEKDPQIRRGAAGSVQRPSESGLAESQGRLKNVSDGLCFTPHAAFGGATAFKIIERDKLLVGTPPLRPRPLSFASAAERQTECRWRATMDRPSMRTKSSFKSVAVNSLMPCCCR